MADVVPNSGLLDKEFWDFLKWSEEKLPPDLLKVILDHTGIHPISSILHIVYAGTMPNRTVYDVQLRFHRGILVMVWL
jgi:hypothetical protein